MNGAAVDERVLYLEFDETGGSLVGAAHYRANHQGSIVALTDGLSGGLSDNCVSLIKGIEPGLVRAR